MGSGFKASAALAGSIVVAVTLPTYANDSATDSSAVAESTGQLEEVVVTARRKEESLQDVPESLNAVTADELQKYNINEFSDLNKVVPGFTATFSNPTATFTLRGLTSQTSNFPPTMQQYLNDAPISPTVLFTSMYDVGQIEVLRGPQGTLRGKIAETGALTLTTHRPDLEQFGGYAQATIGSLDDVNLQGAIGFPIIPDKLAIRFAGISDDNRGSDIASASIDASPRTQTSGGRVTVRFEPTDSFNALVSYEHERRRMSDYGTYAYYGPGNGVDGPPLSIAQRETVWPTPTLSSADYDTAEGTLNFLVAGQTITYVGSYSRFYEHQNIQFNQANIDNVNAATPTDSTTTEWNHDIRISSTQPLIHGYFDYVAGFFYDYTNTPVSSNAGIAYLPGAFGSPLGSPVAGPPNLLFSTAEYYYLPLDEQLEAAWYGNGTIHIDRNTDLSGGLRYSRESHDIRSNVNVPSGTAAAPLPAAACAFVGGQYAVTYAGVCNLATPAISITSPPDVATYHPLIYNVELSHHFSQQLMVYARTASSWRNGALNLVLAAHNNNDPRFAPYNLPSPENVKDYEFGFKGDLFDKRLMYDFDYFHMKYDNFLYTAAAAWYESFTAGVPAASHSSIGTVNESAKVDGVEFNATGLLTRYWTVSGAFAWADGRVTGTAPCDPPGLGPGVSPATALAALQAAGVVTFTCPGLSDSTAHIPRWNLNVESEYDVPINGSVAGFVRGLGNYYPRNTQTSLVGYTAPSYATFDLYIGARHPDARWEVSVYGKNIANKHSVTDIPVSPVTSEEVGTLAQYFPASSGYSAASVIPEREFGVVLRVSVGSR